MNILELRESEKQVGCRQHGTKAINCKLIVEFVSGTLYARKQEALKKFNLLQSQPVENETFEHIEEKLEVLAELIRLDAGLETAEIVQGMNQSHQNVFRYLNILEKEGFLKKTWISLGNSKPYLLSKGGAATFRWALAK